jgi:hypothetical protein
MWAKTPIYPTVVDGQHVVVFGALQDVIVQDPSDVGYQVPLGAKHRLDMISQAFYGVPDLWWVIARVNAELDPLVGIAPGTTIRVPTRARLAREGLLSV